MKRKLITLILCLLSALLLLTGCGQKKILHCDACGKEVKVPADSNMNEDWIILCEDCQKLLDDAVEER